jgi:hypothetical protein
MLFSRALIVNALIRGPRRAGLDLTLWNRYP